MATTKKTTTPEPTKRASRLNFSAHVEDKDALAEVAEALGYMVQRGVNTGLRGSAEGLINAIANGDVVVLPRPVDMTEEVHLRMIRLAGRNRKRAEDRRRAATRAKEASA